MELLELAKALSKAPWCFVWWSALYDPLADYRLISCIIYCKTKFNDLVCSLSSWRSIWTINFLCQAAWRPNDRMTSIATSRHSHNRFMGAKLISPTIIVWNYYMQGFYWCTTIGWSVGSSPIIFAVNSSSYAFQHYHCTRILLSLTNLLILDISSSHSFTLLWILALSMSEDTNLHCWNALHIPIVLQVWYDMLTLRQ